MNNQATTQVRLLSHNISMSGHIWDILSKAIKSIFFLCFDGWMKFKNFKTMKVISGLEEKKSMVLPPFFTLFCRRKAPLWSGPTSKDAKPRVWPGVHSLFYITNAGVNPGLNPGFGVLRCGPRDHLHVKSRSWIWRILHCFYHLVTLYFLLVLIIKCYIKVNKTKNEPNRKKENSLASTMVIPPRISCTYITS
jgi:hypothetical protein